MGRKAAVGIAAALIVGPIAVLVGYKHWLETRIVTPLDVPVSLSRGVITNDFYVNLTGQYQIGITDDPGYGDLPNCQLYGDNSVLNSHLKVFRQGRQIGETDGAHYYGFMAYMDADKRGPYRLEVDVLSDASCLNVGNPRIQVASTGYWFYVERLQTLAWIALVIVLAGLGLLSYVTVQSLKVHGPELGVVDRQAPIPSAALRPLKLRLAKQVSALPHFGMLCATFLVVIVFILVVLETPYPTKGIYVSVNVKSSDAGVPNSAMPPIVVRIQDVGPGLTPKLYVNATAVEWESLEDAVKGQLKLRAQWVVYVDGDSDLPWQNIAQVADIAKGLHAKVVLLTPETRKLVERKVTREKSARR